ncbi:MAG TPA: hypothetical protein VFA32_24260, partial [Dehalococcoidia bacterium]|nr:hypothetical protein [Dehalococcoidia bacterium]
VSFHANHRWDTNSNFHHSPHEQKACGSAYQMDSKKKGKGNIPVSPSARLFLSHVSPPMCHQMAWLKTPTVHPAITLLYWTG